MKTKKKINDDDQKFALDDGEETHAKLLCEYIADSYESLTQIQLYDGHFTNQIRNYFEPLPKRRPQLFKCCQQNRKIWETYPDEAVNIILALKLLEKHKNKGGIFIIQKSKRLLQDLLAIKSQS